MNKTVPISETQVAAELPRLGFLGVGWIGRHRMKAILDSGAANAVAIADPSTAMLKEAVRLAPEAKPMTSIEDLLSEDLDGVVIATPSAQHAKQSIRALDSGRSVFCQKPLGRTAEEVQAVIDAAKAADRLLAVDLSYRHIRAMRRIRDLIRSGDLGCVFAADLTFHNAYGPDKPWFYDKTLSGGGCIIDLGIHLIDLALWSLDFPDVCEVSSHLMAKGQTIALASDQVEDYGVATITLANGAVVRISCSWRLQAGRDAVVEASFYGTHGGAAMRNVGGSFYDFIAERFQGTATESLISSADDWSGRAAVTWVKALAAGGRHDAACQRLVNVSRVIDQIYTLKKASSFAHKSL